MKKIGYTFEFGLDAEPYDLRKIGQKGKSEYYAKGGDLKGDELENVRKDAKIASKTHKEPIYVIQTKQYNYVTKNPYFEYTWATQEDYEYMKGHTYPNYYISVTVMMRYENGELKSVNEEVLFKNENYAKGGVISIYNLRKGDKVRTRKGDIETIVRKTGSGSYETIENDYTHSPESLEFVSRPSRKMAEGGEVFYTEKHKND
jgi:hypothetical protein